MDFIRTNHKGVVALVVFSVLTGLFALGAMVGILSGAYANLPKVSALSVAGICFVVSVATFVQYLGYLRSSDQQL